MHVNKLNVSRVNHLLSGILMVLFGIVILWKGFDFLSLLFQLLALIIIISGISGMISFWTKERNKAALGGALLSTLLGITLLLFGQLPFAVLSILFALYALLNGLVKLVDSILILRNHSEGFLAAAISCLFFFTFGILLLFSPLLHVRAVLVIIGIYCELLGVTLISDGIREMIPVQTKNSLKRRVRISLPVFFAAFLPHRMLTQINEVLALQEGSEPKDALLEHDLAEPSPDLEIFVHVSKDGFCAFGHVDFAFEGELIAYGNYDEESGKRFPGVGDGVLIVTNKEQYIPFCLKFNKTTIFSFGLTLTEEQKESVRERIRQVKKGLIPWQPPSMVDQALGIPRPSEGYPDFSSELALHTNVSFYKFTGGKFKTYFVMSTNCVLLADSIISKAGTDILSINGIISPGTFYDYLEKEYQRKNGRVTSRRVYQLDANLTGEDLRKNA